MTHYNPGDPVVCISTDNLGLLGYGDEVYPTLNAQYTVREEVIDHFGVAGLLLNEIKNDRLPYLVGDKIIDFEKPFASWRFKPVMRGESKKEMEAV